MIGKVPYKRGGREAECSRPRSGRARKGSQGFEEHGAGLVVVDSMAMASGGRGDGEGAEASAVRLFAAFRELGCAILGIDHVTKQDSASEATTAGPYGSVFSRTWPWRCSSCGPSRTRPASGPRWR